MPQTGWLKEQKFIICHLSQFWGPEVRNQAVSVLVPSEIVRERSVSGLFPWLVDGRLHSQVLFFLLVGLCVQISAFYKDTSHIGSGYPPPPMTST